MSDELVQVNGGRLEFSQAVARIAEALHPLGPAARMVAESCALGIELKRLSLAGKQLEADRIEGLARLAERRSSVDASFDVIRQKVAEGRDFGRETNSMLRGIQRRFVDPRTPPDEKQMCVQLLPVLARELTHRTEVDGDDITAQIDTILNGRGGSGPAHRRENRR